jgi:hypothetical protein
MSGISKTLAVLAVLALLASAGVVGAATPPQPSVDAGPAVDGVPQTGAVAATTAAELQTADRDAARRGSRAPTPPFALNVTAARVDGTTVEYTVRFDFHEDAGDVSFEPSEEYALVDLEGLEPNPPGYARVDGAETARLVLRGNATDFAFAVGTETHLAVGTETHLTTSALDGELAWTTADGARRSVFLATAPYVDADWNATVAGPGAMALGGYVHFGPHERLVRHVDGRQFTMIVPPDVGAQFDPTAKMAYLTSMARALDVGGPSGPLVVFAVSEDRGPDRVVRSIPSVGRADLSSFYVVESVWNDTVAHEYVHTRQRFLGNTTPRTRWLVEGGATYYERLYDWRVGDRSLTREVVPSFNHAGETGDAVLSAQFQWETAAPAVPYRKGSAVVAYLDQRIRAETDGERTFADVLRRLNERGGVQSNEKFAAIVADVAGNESLAEVTLRYVTTDAHPAEDHDVVVIPADQRPPEATVVPPSTSESTVGPRTSTATDSGRTPGFGVGAGLAALLALAVAVRRGRRGRRG